MSAIAAENVSKHWTTAAGEVRAVDGLSFAFEQGTLNVLLGPSGCGKSTTLRLIAGLEQADGGRIFIGGRDVTALSPSQRNIAMVFQSYALFPHLSVAENIVFGLRVRKIPADALARRPIAMGDNRIVVTATDPAGNVGTTELSVTRGSGKLRASLGSSIGNRRNFRAASSNASRSAAHSSPKRRCA